ncbi:MAG: hypothetical protein PHN19_00805 [Patescibacteria group bacterium]|nr:hypothetical protein [Patescibacteria group bacterium]
MRITNFTKKTLASLIPKKYKPLAMKYKYEIDFWLSKDKNKNKASVKYLLNKRFFCLQSLNAIKISNNNFRLNIVTDSIKKRSLFGGVATALILATLFSNKYKIPLRIITRTTENNPRDYKNLLNFFKIEQPQKTEFFSDYDRNLCDNNYRIEISEKDIFLATSWWTAEVIRKVNLRKNFFYILQEVEGYFYPNGDEQYMCNSVLNKQNINYIINSKILSDYYSKNGYENVSSKSINFEPAFPKHVYSPGQDSFTKKTKYKLFFYSRPANPRNLFWTGLKILDEAILSGTIDTKEWDIYFVGSKVPPVIFSNGVIPKRLGQLNWNEYSKFLKTVDLGFCLMQTPHPSYPPLDIVSSGGVVLTNKYLNKQSLNYSDNIICENLDEKSMLEGFKQAIKLAKDSKKRQQNYLNSSLETSWEISFEKVLEFMYERK